MNLQDDDFKLLGLPQRHALERATLDDRWRQLQAQVHPDKFASEGAAAQRVAMQWAVRVNEAHGRLKDPLTRAAYLCELRGAPVQAEQNTAMPATFLMQQMAWREALDEAGTLAAVTALDLEVERHESALLAGITRSLDELNDPLRAAQDVRALMFVRRFRADVAKRLDALDA